MPLYDYECLAHGKFESLIGRCPHGCGSGMVKRLPVLSINVGSGKVAATDKMANKLMDRYGMTDMRPTAGSPAKQEPYRWNQKNVVARTAPYSVSLDSHLNPADGKPDVFQQGAAVGAIPEESSTLVQMKREGRMDMKVNVVADDHVTITAKDIANADT